MIDIRIQSADFDPGRQLERLAELDSAATASVVAYAKAGDAVAALVVEHYAAMAKAELARIADEAMARWPLAGIILIHRHGRLAPGERLLFVAAAGEGADSADACAFLREAVGRRAPFWRRELKAAG